ncbi:MAG: CoA ester lyase [Sphingopyxis sp.]
MAASPRSWLFVPGDNDKKLGKIANCGADAVIIDLEDSVTAANKEAARDKAVEYIAKQKGAASPQYWVRINPLDSALALDDIAAVAPAGPAGIVLPKAEGPADVERLSELIDQAGALASTIRIHAIVTETARAVFKLAQFSDYRPKRLCAISWGAEDLASAIGASANRDRDGNFLDVFQHVRIQALLAAHATGVQAVETLHADYRDDTGLRLSCQQSRIVGFTGRLAIHPAQVPIINAAYMPSAEEMAWAQRIIAAFDAATGAGTVGIDGMMIDRPHYLQAQAILARWKEYNNRADSF